jgi:hypothetical protein
MNWLLKKYVIWLLIAVLPIQGFAAIVHHSCGSGHVAVTSSNQAAIAQDALAFEKHHSHDVMNADASRDGCAEHSGHSVKKSSGSNPCKRGLCSTCASCCVGAAAPPVFVTFTLPSKLPEERHTSGATLVIGFIPDSLERPPRNLIV